jgi:hypothetical protein
MKKLLLVLLVLIAGTANAQYTRNQIESRLQGCCAVNSELSEELAKLLTGLSVLNNDAYQTARNAAGTANINVLKVDATDDTVLNADTGDIIKLSIAGTSEVEVSNDVVAFTGATNASVTTSSVDAADGTTLNLSSTSCASGDCSSRGAVIFAYGNEVASVGGGVTTLMGGTTGNFKVQGESGGINLLDIEDSDNSATFIGAITSTAGAITATNGNLVFGTSGNGIRHAAATLAALGSVQGDAAAIVSKATYVTASDATKGVILPASPTAGDQYVVLNTAAAVLKVYPGTGDAINNIAANGAASVAADASLFCIATSASQWYCGELAAP